MDFPIWENHHSRPACKSSSFAKYMHIEIQLIAPGAQRLRK
jgi:hypothetical protein